MLYRCRPYLLTPALKDYLFGSAEVLDTSHDDPSCRWNCGIVTDWDLLFFFLRQFLCFCAAAAANTRTHVLSFSVRAVPAYILQDDEIWWGWWWWWWHNTKKKQNGDPPLCWIAPISAIRAQAAQKSRTETLEVLSVPLALPYYVSVVWLINVFFDF